MAPARAPRRTLPVLLAAAGLPAVARSAPQVAAVPFEYSPEYDLYNQGKAVEYFEAKFYNEGTKWALNDEQLEEVDRLRSQALKEPVLALGAAQVLYMFAWFRKSGEILRDNIVAAAQLFEQSISVGGCDPALPSDLWVDSGCDIRWAQPAMLYNWLGDTEADTGLQGAFHERAQALLKGLKQHSRYAKVGQDWTSPYQINFNALRFPEAPSRPIWNASRVPLARFLEEHHATFKEELEAIVNDPRDLFEQLRRADGSKECLATPGGWDTVRIVRYGHWYDHMCALAPRTCELLASRPEVSNCTFVNANIQKLYPNSHLKPHFGNAPRLAAHLPVIAPEPLRAAMMVGVEQTFWLEGKVVVFDDTFPHAVSHWGSLPRYVLNVWFCHPCDENNAHNQTCPETA